MDRATFDDLFKEALANLYDYAALEAQPQLFALLPPPPGYAGSRADYVRQFLTQAIEAFRPPNKALPPSAPEWRPYLILYRRYVDGLSLAELSAELSLSERQLRRDHHRALTALLNRLWEQLAPQSAVTAEEPALFELNNETIELNSTLDTVLNMLKARLQQQNIVLNQRFAAQLIQVETDRVVLRQVLINLLQAALHMNSGSVLELRTYAESPLALVEVCGTHLPGEGHPLLQTIAYWCERIHAQFETKLADASFCLRLSLPLAGLRILLVIDDQQPAIQLFRRYLSRTAYTVIGLTQAPQAVEMAQRLRPALITLDVMMPQMDGWEILQALKLNEVTRAIPVLVCSAWADPDLALSLGAAGFLKKPVTQKALFDMLQTLNLPVD